MNDRELLTFAAKAAGVFVTRKELARLLPKWDWSEEYEPCYFDTGAISGWRIWHGPRGEIGGAEEYTWNPIGDDGDALRLAVKLGLNDMITINVGWAAATVEFKNSRAIGYEIHQESQDAYAATRRAIVCAAAEIGKAMP